MRTVFAATLAAITLLAGGCASAADKNSVVYSDNPRVLNIVMGSEQHLVFEQIERPWCEKNKLDCNAKELGSVD